MLEAVSRSRCSRVTSRHNCGAGLGAPSNTGARSYRRNSRRIDETAICHWLSSGELAYGRPIRSFGWICSSAAT